MNKEQKLKKQREMIQVNEWFKIYYNIYIDFFNNIVYLLVNNTLYKWVKSIKYSYMMYMFKARKTLNMEIKEE